MSENNQFVGEVNNHTVKGIDVHSLVADDQLPIAMLLIFQDKHVGISNVELISHVDDKFTVKFFSTISSSNDRFLSIHPNKEVAKLSPSLVRKDVEAPCVVDDRFNGRNFKFLIYVYFFLVPLLIQIQVNTVISRSDDTNLLSVIHLKKHWLLVQWLFEDVDCHASFLFEIELQNSVSLCENNGVAFSTYWVIFEDKVHAYTLQIFYIRNTDWSLADLGEFFVDSFSVRSFSGGFLENEQLVRLLSIFDQVFACDDSEQLLIWTDVHGNDFIPLSAR